MFSLAKMREMLPIGSSSGSSGSGTGSGSGAGALDAIASNCDCSVRW